VDASYASEYRELYERHWWWRARERLILDELQRLSANDGWKSILDVGCGDALFFDALSRFGDVEGVEPDASLVSPDGPHRSRIHVGPFDRSFRPARRFGLILMLDVLEHLPEPGAALAYAHELLEPGGTLFVTVPAFPLLWTRHDVLNRHYTRYTRRTLQRLTGDAGFEVQVSRYFYHWMFPAKIATRLLEAVRPSAAPTPPRVPPSWLNRFLYFLSRAEQRALRALPLSLPFGSSLLVVARKTTRAPQ
jgi:SAM-dependent methyltransferase